MCGNIMAKRDLSYIKHMKPQIKMAERDIKYDKDMRKIQQIQALQNMRYVDEKSEYQKQQEEICKRAAKMGNRERLMYFFSTLNGTYLGVGCKWDSLTKLGRDKTTGKYLDDIL
jgi:hypothetical protein